MWDVLLSPCLHWAVIKIDLPGAGAKLQLKEWLITDAQGLSTRVTVSNLVLGRKVAANKFKTKDFTSQPFGQ